MELDVEALQMLEGDEPTELQACDVTCEGTCLETRNGGY